MFNVIASMFGSAKRIKELESRLERESDALDYMAWKHPETWKAFEHYRTYGQSIGFRPGVAALEIRRGFATDVSQAYALWGR